MIRESQFSEVSVSWANKRKKRGREEYSEDLEGDCANRSGENAIKGYISKERGTIRCRTEIFIDFDGK